jgi:hypothetical protein
MYNNNDADERDSGCSDDNDDNDDDGTEDEEEVGDDVGNRRETAGEGTCDETVHRSSQPRATIFTGFKDPAHELLLLKALDTVRPFGVQHGQTGTAWSRVVQYLRDHDDKEQAEGRPRVFDDVNPRVCQARWKNLSSEYAAHETAMLRATGVNPEITDRLKYIQPVYEFEQACRKTTDDNKDKRHRKKARTESNRVEGLLLLERSRTGPVRVAPDLPQPIQGFMSGTESESGVSVVSNRTPRTPGMKKRTMATMLTGQFQEASTILMTQAENQRRQLDMMVEDREERRKLEEERRKVDEDTRREQAAIHERQQKALMDCMERIATQQAESTKEVAKQQAEAAKQQAETVKQHAESTERLILAIVAGFNKKN